MCMLQALRDMDTEMLRKLLGNVNLPSWINFPGTVTRWQCCGQCHASMPGMCTSSTGNA
jgi:hypothetical protein